MLKLVKVFLHLATGLVKNMQTQGRNQTVTEFGFGPADVGCREISLGSRFPNKVELVVQSMIFQPFPSHHWVDVGNIF